MISIKPQKGKNSSYYLLVSLLEETMISDTIAGHLVNVLQLICVLVCSAPLIKKFLVVCVVPTIIL